MQNSENLERGGPWPVHYRIVWISSQRPETEWTACQVWTGVAAQGAFGDESASIINRLLYPVGGIFAVLGNVRPDVKDVRFGKGR